MSIRAFLAAALIALLLLLSGCQTICGLGGDIQWLGEKSSEVLEK